MVRSGTPDGADGQQSLGDLVALAAKDISQLVQYEISLAKSELKMDVRRVGVTAGLVAFAAVVVALIAFVLCFAYAYGLEAAGVPGGLWGAFLFVALTLLVLFLVACGVAYLVVKRVTGMRLTRQSMQGNLEMLRRSDAGPDGAAAVVKNPTTAKTAESVGSAAAAEIPARQLPGVDQMAMPSESAVQLSGPWAHRSVSANGTRFHVATSGEGPLVLLLHGFPEFWWTWRHQLVSLPQAGYRAVAVDLRGYGGSDKPPRGYDLITAAADAAGLIRALGEANAIVVGHDWGALAAWTLAAYFPKAVRRLAVVSMAHPLRMRAAVLSSPLRVSRSLRLSPSPGAPGSPGHAGYPLAFQLPVLPERQLVRDGAALVGSILSSWSAPGWPDQETSRIYQRAMRIPPVAHTALEYHRWFVRSSLRPDGLRYARHMRTPVAAPVLHLHGAVDPCVLPQTARGAGRYVEAPYRWKVIDGAGHFPHEERPVLFDAELLGWLADPEPDR
jgi:pimeloyl-ACP methyl ester carboxylesterase